MSDVVIKVENLSKKYRLGLINHGMLSKDLQSFWARIRGKDDPNAMLGKGEGLFDSRKDEIYALKDINFEVRQGEVLGIIGANGAGKSTLLKILSRVTAPTTGMIKIKGRIGSLLEVGTGFHPELTGRENIYLNGAILGMRRWEIDKKLDEIIDFSGVEKFIDTPVKRYSSGMYVRLAFAVAAHLDPEILVVDEVLAVGDAEFQKKCLGKMGDISTKEGRTVLFVSHNMATVSSLCNNALLIEKGVLSFVGEVNDVINQYVNIGRTDHCQSKLNVGDKTVLIEDLWIKSSDDEISNKMVMGQKMDLFIKIKKKEEFNYPVYAGFGINDYLGDRLVTFNNLMINEKLANISGTIIKFEINDLNLLPGKYLIDASIVNYNMEYIDNLKNVTELEIVETDIYSTGKIPSNLSQGKIFIKPKMSVIRKK